MTAARRTATIRGIAAASLSTFAALAGHVTGGGQMPGPLGIMVPWVLSCMVCVVLAGRRLSLARLSASVAISQFLFHALFVLGVVEISGHGHAHSHGSASDVLTGVVAPAIAHDGLMWVGHGLAEILTVIVAHRGERMLRALRTVAMQVAAWVRRRLDIELPQSTPGEAHGRGAPPEVIRPVTGQVLSALRGRAPPTGCMI